MADVAARIHDRTARADTSLAILEGLWQDVPGMIEEWDEWDAFSRLQLHAEWFGYNDKLSQLTEWAREGSLTPSQRARYDALMGQVARYRPAIERLLNG